MRLRQNRRERDEEVHRGTKTYKCTKTKTRAVFAVDVLRSVDSFSIGHARGHRQTDLQRQTYKRIQGRKQVDKYTRTNIDRDEDRYTNAHVQKYTVTRTGIQTHTC